MPSNVFPQSSAGTVGVPSNVFPQSSAGTVGMPSNVFPSHLLGQSACYPMYVPVICWYVVTVQFHISVLPYTLTLFLYTDASWCSGRGVSQFESSSSGSHMHAIAHRYGIAESWITKRHSILGAVLYLAIVTSHYTAYMWRGLGPLTPLPILWYYDEWVAA